LFKNILSSLELIIHSSRERTEVQVSPSPHPFKIKKERIIKGVEQRQKLYLKKYGGEEAKCFMKLLFTK
jgi:hypothetical protein